MAAFMNWQQKGQKIMNETIIIIGAGFGGLSAALTLAERDCKCVLVSRQPSERAQSVLAEGGISGALSQDAEDIFSHYQDTMKAGCDLADSDAVRRMVQFAPEIIRQLKALGASFQMESGTAALRKLGGHSRARTSFAGNSTGKVIMTALIDEVRKKEVLGIVKRLPHHVFESLLLDGENCQGCIIRDYYSGQKMTLYGSVILASGGMSGLFPGKATGGLENDGNVTASVFRQGVELGNLEFIQYHPTAVTGAGKKLLVSESARSYGGRLFIKRGTENWYFLEDFYGPEGNLVTRDTAVKKMQEVSEREDCELPIYLDMSGINKKVWEEQLFELRGMCEKFLGINPQKDSVPVEPAIHYFMGGILADKNHRTNKKFLYAAGECACQYHGANRLGGNSILGAIYGGQKAAETAVSEIRQFKMQRIEDDTGYFSAPEAMDKAKRLGEILEKCMGIMRNEDRLRSALCELEEWFVKTDSWVIQNKLLLGIAIVKSALERRESRGAHWRADYPREEKDFQRITVARFEKGKVKILFRKISEDEVDVG